MFFPLDGQNKRIDVMDNVTYPAYSSIVSHLLVTALQSILNYLTPKQDLDSFFVDIFFLCIVEFELAFVHAVAVYVHVVVPVSNRLF